MLNVKKLLTKILSLKPMFEYVGNYSGDVYNTSWTATDNGVAIVRATWDTTQSFGYWYVQDSTENKQVANLGGTSNGTSLSCMIPIIKGHVYNSAGHDHVYYAFFEFYKIKLGGGVLLKGIIRNILTPCRKVVGVC